MKILLDSTFRDLDSLHEQVKAWDLDFRVLKGAGFAGSLRQIGMPEVLVSHASFENRLHQSGTTPHCYQTFALPANRCHGFWWLGLEVDEHSVMRFGSDHELSCASNEDFAVYTVSIHDHYQTRLLESLRVSFPKERAVIRLPEGQLSELQCLAQMTLLAPSRHSRARLAKELATKLLTCCYKGEPAKRPNSRVRDRAINRVVEFLQCVEHVQPDIPQLCRVASVSERTLQYAFRERYGMSPNQFVRCWGLNDARRLLRSEDQWGKEIAAIAAECGFHDPSLFSKQYRLLYGELPSSTLAEAKRALKPDATFRTG